MWMLLVVVGVSLTTQDTAGGAGALGMPAHPPFLTGSAGIGDVGSARAAADRASLPDDRPPSACDLGPRATAAPGAGRDCTLEATLRAFGVALDQPAPNGAGPIPFVSATELDAARTVSCQAGPRAVVCHTRSSGGLDVIIQTAAGMRFLSYPAARPGAPPTLTRVHDHEGAKLVPFACLACHGGRYDPATRLVQGATLLPVDPGLVDLRGRRPRYEEAIRRFNAIIYRPPVGRPSDAVAQYINELYGGSGAAGGTVLKPGRRAAARFVPRGWAADPGFYLDVVKTQCAMCHLGTNPAVNFLSLENFLQEGNAILAAVCERKTMPHAEVPFRRFWAGARGHPDGPRRLAARLGKTACS